jgi:hypothetical protein
MNGCWFLSRPADPRLRYETPLGRLSGKNQGAILVILVLFSIIMGDYQNQEQEGEL